MQKIVHMIFFVLALELVDIFLFGVTSVKS